MNAQNSSAPAKKKKKYGIWIATIAVAAAVIIISLIAMQGGFGRKKTDSVKESGSPKNASLQMDQGSPADEAAEAEQELHMEHNTYKPGTKTDAENKDKSGNISSLTGESSLHRRDEYEKAEDAVQEEMIQPEPEATQPANEATQPANEATQPANEEARTVENVSSELYDTKGGLLSVSDETDPHLYTEKIPVLGLSLEVTDIRPEGGNLVFRYAENDQVGKGQLLSGTYFELQRLEGNTWKRVPLIVDQNEVAWEDIGWIVSVASSEWRTDWSWLYGALSAGTYRIIKPVWSSHYIGAYKEYLIAAEFAVQ